MTPIDFGVTRLKVKVRGHMCRMSFLVLVCVHKIKVTTYLPAQKAQKLEHQQNSSHQFNPQAKQNLFLDIDSNDFCSSLQIWKSCRISSGSSCGQISNITGKL